jgi:uncharacterized lipoprotein YajG
MPALRLAVLAALLLTAACKSDPHWAAATPNHDVLERIARESAQRPSPFAWSTIESRAQQQREVLARNSASHPRR